MSSKFSLPYQATLNLCWRLEVGWSCPGVPTSGSRITFRKSLLTQNCVLFWDYSSPKFGNHNVFLTLPHPPVQVHSEVLQTLVQPSSVDWPDGVTPGHRQGKMGLEACFLIPDYVAWGRLLWSQILSLESLIVLCREVPPRPWSYEKVDC